MTETEVNVFCQVRPTSLLFCPFFNSCFSILPFIRKQYSQAQQLTAHEKVFDSYEDGDLLRLAVTSHIVESDKVFVTMKEEVKSSAPGATKIKLGLISEEELPAHYRKIRSHAGGTFDDVIKNSLSFNNPSASQYLAGVLIRPPEARHLSFLKPLRDKIYSDKELASNMRKVQSAKWASKSLEAGIASMRAGKELEAHQQLNKALQIDPDSVDAYVARGCLFANNGSLKKALDDFERALDINPNHSNARKYMSDTLLDFAKT